MTPMARETLYLVQAFVDVDGKLLAKEPMACRSARDAQLIAQALATRKAGVRALALSQDPGTGKWNRTPEILFEAGRTIVASFRLKELGLNG
jgi:hypothetical protein